MQVQEVMEHQIILPQQRKEGSRYIFFAGDIIAPSAKARDPRFARGGVVKANQTLNHCSGFIPQCEITEMRQHMQTVAMANVQANDRQNWAATYQELDPATGETKTIGLRPDGSHDGYLRRAIYPMDDVTELVGAATGIIEMPVRSRREAMAAQRFLFPDGTVPPAVTVHERRRYFEGRLAMADSTFEVMIAEAAIRSCDDLIRHANLIIAEARAEYDRAKTKGIAWTLGSVARSYHQMLGLATPDQAAQANDAKFDQLVEVTANLATAVANRQPEPVVSAPFVQTANVPDAPVTMTVTPPPVQVSEGFRVMKAGREGTVTQTNLPFGKVGVLFDGDDAETKVSKNELTVI